VARCRLSVFQIVLSQPSDQHLAPAHVVRAVHPERLSEATFHSCLSYSSSLICGPAFCGATLSARGGTWCSVSDEKKGERHGGTLRFCSPARGKIVISCPHSSFSSQVVQAWRSATRRRVPSLQRRHRRG
jgi:hypothetical protein